MFKAKWGMMLLLLAAAAVLLPAQAAEPPVDRQTWSLSIPTLSLEFVPSFLIPIGPDASLFSFGVGGELAAIYRIPPVPFLFVGGGLGYAFQGTSAPGTSLSLGSVGVQAGVGMQLTQAISARLFGDAGYFIGGFNETGATVEGNPYYGGGLAAGYRPVAQLHPRSRSALPLLRRTPQRDHGERRALYRFPPVGRRRCRRIQPGNQRSPGPQARRYQTRKRLPRFLQALRRPSHRHRDSARTTRVSPRRMCASASL